MSETIGGGFKCTWQVQVFGGSNETIDLKAPMKFGTPMMYLSPVGQEPAASTPEDVTVPLIYGPVALHQYGSFLAICTPGEPVDQGDGHFLIPQRNWREMECVTRVEFSTFGHIDVEGLERRADGSAIFVRWEVEPFQDEATVES